MWTCICGVWLICGYSRLRDPVENREWLSLCQGNINFFRCIFDCAPINLTHEIDIHMKCLKQCQISWLLQPVLNCQSLAARGQRSQRICPVYIYDFKCLLLYRINISAVIERRGFFRFFIQKDTSWYWWFLFQKRAAGGIAEWQTSTK